MMMMMSTLSSSPSEQLLPALSSRLPATGHPQGKKWRSRFLSASPQLAALSFHTPRYPEAEWSAPSSRWIIPLCVAFLFLSSPPSPSLFSLHQHQHPGSSLLLSPAPARPRPVRALVNAHPSRPSQQLRTPNIILTFTHFQ